MNISTPFKVSIIALALIALAGAAFSAPLENPPGKTTSPTFDSVTLLKDIKVSGKSNLTGDVDLGTTAANTVKISSILEGASSLLKIKGKLELKPGNVTAHNVGIGSTGEGLGAFILKHYLDLSKWLAMDSNSIASYGSPLNINADTGSHDKVNIGSFAKPSDLDVKGVITANSISTAKISSPGTNLLQLNSSTGSNVLVGSLVNPSDLHVNGHFSTTSLGKFIEISSSSPKPMPPKGVLTTNGVLCPADTIVMSCGYVVQYHNGTSVVDYNGPGVWITGVAAKVADNGCATLMFNDTDTTKYAKVKGVCFDPAFNPNALPKAYNPGEKTIDKL